MPGPAGLHAWAHLPRRERPGLLPGSPGGGPAEHDQRVGVTVLEKSNSINPSNTINSISSAGLGVVTRAGIVA